MRSRGRGSQDLLERRQNKKKKGNNKEKLERKTSEEEIFGQICKGARM